MREEFLGRLRWRFSLLFFIIRNFRKDVEEIDDLERISVKPLCVIIEESTEPRD